MARSDPLTGSTSRVPSERLQPASSFESKLTETRVPSTPQWPAVAKTVGATRTPEHCTDPFTTSAPTYGWASPSTPPPVMAAAVETVTSATASAATRLGTGLSTCWNLLGGEREPGGLVAGVKAVLDLRDESSGGDEGHQDRRRRELVHWRHLLPRSCDPGATRLRAGTGRLPDRRRNGRAQGRL